MIFESIKQFKEEYTKAKLQGYSLSPSNWALHQCLEHNKSCPICEDFILENVDTIYHYIEEIKREPWPEAEHLIKTDSYYSTLYFYYFPQREGL